MEWCSRYAYVVKHVTLNVIDEVKTSVYNMTLHWSYTLDDVD